MKLQIATRLALYAVLQLAADPARQFSAAEIAERFGISVNHLAKVLRTLGRAGLVEALRGAGGGYRFRGNARRVTLLDVIQLFEEVGPSPRSDDEPGAASPEGRALRQVMDEIDDIARATVGSITLATMLKLMEQHRAPAPTATRGGSERERGGGASAGAQRR
jgi:Rrf2 family transcriptional regulator, nitric oxide-sensitive transcriptional repressor